MRCPGSPAWWRSGRSGWPWRLCRLTRWANGALPATLIETVFLGDHLRLRLQVGQPGRKLAEMVVKRPAGVPVGSLKPGQASVAWQPYQAWGVCASAWVIGVPGVIGCRGYRETIPGYRTSVIMPVAM